MRNVFIFILCLFTLSVSGQRTPPPDTPIDLSMCTNPSPQPVKKNVVVVQDDSAPYTVTFVGKDGTVSHGTAFPAFAKKTDSEKLKRSVYSTYDVFGDLSQYDMPYREAFPNYIAPANPGWNGKALTLPKGYTPTYKEYNVTIGSEYSRSVNMTISSYY